MQALLVNSGTASTTEMLAASLHDNAHAQLIGEHSYGKGRTQRILNMKDGSTLLVSTSLVTTPTFHRIDKVSACHVSTPQPGLPAPPTGRQAQRSTAVILTREHHNVRWQSSPGSVVDLSVWRLLLSHHVC